MQKMQKKRLDNVDFIVSCFGIGGIWMKANILREPYMYVQTYMYKRNITVQLKQDVNTRWPF